MADFSVYTSYGRTALYLALSVVNIQGKEVLLPAFTCNTTVVDAIVQAGGEPIFVDINPANLEMVKEDLHVKISKKTKVIIAHHYYGSYCNNVDDLDLFAKEHGLIHIEDFAHGLGLKKKPVGDIAIYSYSKNMNNPGGGKVWFRDPELFEKGLVIQSRCRSIFHDFVTNYESFKYLYDLTRDRGCFNAQEQVYRVRDYVRRGVIKLLKTSGFYQENFFYRINEGDFDKKYKFFDTRMTKKQKYYIEKSLTGLNDIIVTRKQKALKLNDILPSFLALSDNVVTNYTFLSKQLGQIETFLAKLNIRTRRTWPAFQRYWSKQLTKNVKYLAEHLLLIDIDCVNDDNLTLLKEKIFGSQLL
jgi:hypothetical protein